MTIKRCERCNKDFKAHLPDTELCGSCQLDRIEARIPVETVYHLDRIFIGHRLGGHPEKSYNGRLAYGFHLLNACEE